VLDEVGIACLRGAFVAGSRIDPDTDGDGFEGWDSLGDEANPVIENKLAVQELLAGRVLGGASCRHRNRLFSTEPDLTLLIDLQNFHENLVPFRDFV
jgi:hypothetical protein